MAGNKYLAVVSGDVSEKAAIQSSAGAGDAGKITALDSTGRLDSSMMPVGYGDDTNSIQASEGLSAGDYVNVYSLTGAFRVRKADASTAGKEAHGFVLAAVTSGDNATVFFEGTNTQVSGQTPGKVYLSAIAPGEGAATYPTSTGNILQRIGYAVSATAVNFDAGQYVVLA